ARAGPVAGPFPARDWLIFAGLAVGPTLIGHSGQNYALRHLPAFAVGAVMLAEPIGSALIAWLLPGVAERPPVTVIWGGAICLLGVALTLTQRSQRNPRE